MGKEHEDAYKEAIENYRAITQARLMKSSETCLSNVAHLLPRRQISNYFLEFRKVLELFVLSMCSYLLLRTICF